MKRLILLDRNVVITIKQKINGQKILSERKIKIKKIDRPGNIISPLLSIQEGQISSKENIDQYKDTLIKESLLISSFFHYASVDSNYLINNADMFADAFTNHSEKMWLNYISFISEMQTILYQKISKLKQNEYKEKILKLAALYCIPFKHPIVICCLSVLYGCDKLSHILNARQNRKDEYIEKDAYNTVSDIMVISRMSTIRAIMKTIPNIRLKLDFMTFDIGLDFFIKCTHVNDVSHTTEEDNKKILINVTYDRNLFPDLNEKEYWDISNGIY